MRGEFPAMRFSPALLAFLSARYWAKVADNFPNTTDSGGREFKFPSLSANESLSLEISLSKSRIGRYGVVGRGRDLNPHVLAHGGF